MCKDLEPDIDILFFGVLHKNLEGLRNGSEFIASAFM